MHGFVQKVRRQLRRHRLVEPGARVLAAVSGGPDSVALARSLAALAVPFEIAYVDHRTRPETADEARFVAALAAELGRPFHALTCDPGRASEAELREGRYAALRGVGLELIATGHTASDQAETVLLRLVRGTGTSGLSGMAPRRGDLVRPLLGVTRDDVMAYLGDLGQPYCTDPTNEHLDPLRNRVRWRLLPLLRDELQPRIDALLCRLADAARADREALEALASAHLARHGLALGPLCALHPGLRVHVLREACPVALTEERLAALQDLVASGRGQVQIEGRVTAEVPSGGRQLVFRAT